MLFNALLLLVMILFIFISAVQHSGSIHRLSSINEGIQGKLVNDGPGNLGPYKTMLVLGQEGFSPHALSV